MLAHTRSLCILALGAVSVHAAFSVSNTCQNTLKGLLASKDAACLNPGVILSFVVGAESSLKDTVDNWVTGICSTGSCSDATLDNVVANLTSGCAAELQTVGAGAGVQAQIADIVKRTYPTVRKIVCLKDDISKRFCVTQTITNVETSIGDLQIADLSFLSILEDARKLIATGIKSLVCTDCIKAAYTVARTDFPEIVSEITDESSGLCGAQFVDGATPETVSQTAVPGVFAAEKDNSASRPFSPTISLTLLGMFLVYSVLA